MKHPVRWLGAVPALLALASCATPQAPTLGAFEQALAAQDSATAALSGWCAAHHIAEPAIVSARPAGAESVAPSAAIRAALEVSEQETVGYRHVLLACGDTVLSVAQNWYVPGRLTHEMNVTLDTTETPFGRAVAALGFTRERLDAVQGAIPECPADTILSHRALLRLSDGSPISLVVECYTPANLVGQAK